MRSAFTTLAAALLCATHALAQSTPLAITNARIITMRGDKSDPAAGEISRGTLLVQHGTILAVGENIPIPAGATTIDAAGKVIMPGLVDTHNHIGGIGGADGSGSIQPDVRVSDSINPMDSGFRRAVSGGLTTLNIMPGSGHLLSGQTIYAKLRPAKTIDDLAIRPLDANGKPDPTKPALGGMKFANGTNSLREPPFSGTRAKSAAMIRDRFIKAQEYAKKIADANNDPTKLPDRDLGLEALGEVLRGTRIVHHHTHRTDDIMTVLRLQKEFGFRVVLHHVSEAWKIPDEIAQAQQDTGGKLLGCSVILVDSPGGKLEAANMSMACSGILEKAGVNVCIHTDDWINDCRFFFREGALAVRYGMSRTGALRALTIEGARMLDLADRIGSLEAGKDADFVILSGDPFSTYTKVEQTFVEGTKVYDRSNPADALFATGGFGAGRDQEPYLCCIQTGFTFNGKSYE